ncbi:recombinase family protein [Robiginitalea aurantiaca]|uniref:Recombinase family protein n=1 Tax=Robiginitalea aurantiaca TaxID=3056915 RepID=A0ABT7WFA9_9FLAO|nr:recombinase family protein [Robiginitalea aurantiaca]MDM9631606.1 recombinase family protein [Robiginitalea aurantiaca]
MKYVVYYRVSTKDQNLGLDAQRSMVEKSLKAEDEVLRSFTEKETGTNKKFRPILQEALNLCKETGAILLIAKLDRLARNVSVISTLMESGIQFQAVDMPAATNLTIHIFAAIAEHEADIISQRTKSALKEIKSNIKENGHHISKSGNKVTSLGSPSNLTDEARRKAVEAIKNKKRLNPRNRQAKALIRSLHKEGKKLSEIARELNDNGFTASRGGKFRAEQVKRLIEA